MTETTRWKYDANSLGVNIGHQKLRFSNRPGREMTREQEAELRQSRGQLIAESPKLLASLKALVAIVREYYADDLTCDHSVNICGCELRRRVEAAEDSIARAEGAIVCRSCDKPIKDYGLCTECRTEEILSRGEE